MRVRISAVIVLLAISLSAPAQTAPNADAMAYAECTSAASAQGGSRDKAIEKCEAPAKAGIPGAQYVLGVVLLDRNEAGDRTAGLEWLEKSAATGHPAAEFALATDLLQQDSPASVSRGRDLLKKSICTGYPQAMAVLKQQGVTREQIHCAPVPEEDFTGEWIAELTSVKSGLAAADNKTYPLKLVISGENVQVFAKNGNDWFEVKPGLFKLTRLDRSAVVNAVDSGWDFDGQWIESWTIALLRVGVDDVRVSYLRTVNNPYMPASLSWSSFFSHSEGVAHRGKK